MTICVAIKVHDGLVFAADSTTTLATVGPDGRQIIHNTYVNANKVFNLLKGKPVVSMTSGIGNFGNRSISKISKEIRMSLSVADNPLYVDPNEFTIQEISEKARTYILDLYLQLENELRPQGDHVFDYWIGGFGSENHLAELWKVQIINGLCDEPKLILGPEVCDIAWGGQPEAINRLVLGYGQKMPDILKSAGVSDEDLPQLMGLIARNSVAPILSPAMPIQDAIDLSAFLVDATKQYVKFCVGADTVGGETDIAAVTKHEGFKWIRRKHYYPTELNRETDHD